MIKKILLAIVLIVVVLGGSLYLNKHHLVRIKNDLPPYTHAIDHMKSEMVAMRDGVKLFTRTYIPEGKGPWPSVLMRNPYARMDPVFSTFCEMFARYGYACTIQFTRGQGPSEGIWEPVVNEPNDGSDTLYWMAEQSWMDGNMAMWGGSYLALTQWAAAFDYPSELKTFVPISMGTNFHKILYEKGMFRHFATWWTLLMPDREMRPDAAKPEVLIEVTQHFPHIEIDEKFIGQKLDWYREWVGATSMDSPTWKREDAIQLSRVAKNLDIPLLLIDGWYDPFFSSQFQDYLNLGTKEQSRMIIGPWSHIQRPAGDLLPEETKSAMSIALNLSLEWFDHHLRGKPLEGEGFIKTYDIGLNQWKSRTVWPPETIDKQFQLTAFALSNTCDQGGLVEADLIERGFLEKNLEERGLSERDLAETSFAEGSLSADSNSNDNVNYNDSNNEKVSYDYDPNKPVESRGGSGFLLPLADNMKPGAILQDGICEREDVLTFMSPALTSDISITGDIKVVLKVSSSAEDTAFTAKIIDVYPDGRAVNIRDSISTLAYRNDVRSPLTYEPNTIVDVNIDMWPIEWTLQKGHRLRLDISSSNFPAFNIHSNFSGPWALQKETKVATQTIYSPSFIQLPIEVQSIASMKVQAQVN